MKSLALLLALSSAAGAQCYPANCWGGCCPPQQPQYQEPQYQQPRYQEPRYQEPQYQEPPRYEVRPQPDQPAPPASEPATPFVPPPVTTPPMAPEPSLDQKAWLDWCEQNKKDRAADAERLNEGFKSIVVAIEAGNHNDNSTLEAKLDALAAAIQQQADQLKQAMQPKPFYLRVNPHAQYQPVNPGQYVTLPLDRAQPATNH